MNAQLNEDSQLNSETQESSKQQKFQPTVFYTWFGKQVPQDYLISLSQIQYPLTFLKNPKIQRNFERSILDIQKSDYYRLQHLYNYGGIYSDFDNIINYQCLRKKIEPLKDQDFLFTMFDNLHNKKQKGEVMNNFIFAPRPKMPILKEILDSVNEYQQKIAGFAGLKFLGKFNKILQIDVRQCIEHHKDWSWYQDAGAVSNRINEAHYKFAKKLVKKVELIKQNEMMLQQNKQEIQRRTKLFDLKKDKQELLYKKISQIQTKSSKLKIKTLQIKSKSSQLNSKKSQLTQKQKELRLIEVDKQLEKLNKFPTQVQKIKQAISLKEYKINQKLEEIAKKDQKMEQMVAQMKRIREDLKFKNSQIQFQKQKMKDNTQIQSIYSSSKQTFDLLQQEQNSIGSVTQQLNKILQSQQNTKFELNLVILVVILIFLFFLGKKLVKSVRNVNNQNTISRKKVNQQIDLQESSLSTPKVDLKN